MGSRHLLNSPEKFEKILSDLEGLMEKVKQKALCPEVRQTLYALYGEDLSLSAAQIVRLYYHLMEAKNPLEETSVWKTLETLLNEEIRDVSEEYELYLGEHVKVKRTQMDAALASTSPNWQAMIRHEEMLHRQIEQKLKLLEAIQARRREQSKNRTRSDPVRPSRRSSGQRKRAVLLKQSQRLIENTALSKKQSQKRSEVRPSERPICSCAILPLRQRPRSDSRVLLG